MKFETKKIESFRQGEQSHNIVFLEQGVEGNAGDGVEYAGCEGTRLAYVFKCQIKKQYFPLSAAVPQEKIATLKGSVLGWTMLLTRIMNTFRNKIKKASKLHG